jgi:hypothetical protein
MEKENNGIIEFPKPKKRFEIPSLSDAEMEAAGIPREDVSKIAEEAEKIAESTLEKAKKNLKEKEGGQKTSPFKVIK